MDTTNEELNDIWPLEPQEEEAVEDRGFLSEDYLDAYHYSVHENGYSSGKEPSAIVFTLNIGQRGNVRLDREQLTTLSEKISDVLFEADQMDKRIKKRLEEK